MSNEKTSEGADWRHRLGQLDTPPDTDLAWKEPAWEKLYTRLQKKEQLPRRRMGWYWAAAACLVLGVAIYLLPGKAVRPGHPGQPGYTAASGQPGYTAGLDQPAGSAASGKNLPSAGVTTVEPTSSEVTSSAVTSPGVTSSGVTSSGVTPSEVTSVAVTSSGVTSAGQPQPPASPIHPATLAGQDQLTKRSVPGPVGLHQPVVVAAGAPQPSIHTATTEHATFAANTAQPSVLTDSTVLAATAPPLVPVAKRRLRVVHINELGIPVPEDSPSSHMAGNFFLRIRLFNNDAPANQLMGSNNEINLTQSFKISFKN